MTLPLSGIRVLDLSRLLPGPMCSHWLEQMGAEILKIEAPGLGDYARWFEPHLEGYYALFTALNRGKRSVTLNLRTEQGRAILEELLPWHDVLLEGFRPGVLERLGLAPERLREKFPRLIVCSITGYGQTGPFAEKAGHDLNYVGLSGLSSLNREPDGSPHVPGLQIADVAGGASFALSSILAALYQRERTGKGQHLDVSMTESATALLSHLHAIAEALGHTPTPEELPLLGSYPAYRHYETKDGRFMAVGIIEPPFLKEFRRVMEVPDDLDEEHLADFLTEKFRTRTRSEWAAIFAASDCCVTEVVDLMELPEHPHHQGRGTFSPAGEHEGRRTHAVSFPVAFHGKKADPGQVPGLGDHTASVLEELGYGADEIENLRSLGVI